MPPVTLHLLVLTLLITPSVELDIAWLAPESANENTRVTSALGGLALAVDKINSDSSLLNGESLNVQWKNSGCDSKTTINSVYEILSGASYVNPDVIVGPPCSNAMTYVGQLAGFRSIPIFGWQSTSTSLADSSTYTSMIRVQTPTNTVASGLLLMLQYFVWDSVAIVAGTDADSTDMGAALNGIGENVNITRFQDQAAAGDEQYIDESLRSIEKVARIIILAIPRSELAAWLLKAKDMKMTTKDYVYIWINTELPSQSLYDTIASGDFYNNDKSTREAFKSLLLFTPSMDYVDGVPSFMTDANLAAKNQVLSILGPSYSAAASDITSPYLHDAVLLWAKLAQEVKNSGQNLRDGTIIKTKAKMRSFTGNAWVTGNIYLNENSDREPDFWLMNMADDDLYRTALELSHPVRGNTFSREIVDVEDIIWSDGSKGYDNRPKAIPDCGFSNENCPDLALYIALPVVVVLLIIAGIVAFFVYKKYQFEQSLKDMMWKVSRTDMVMKGDKKLAGSAFAFMSRCHSFPSMRSLRKHTDRHKDTDTFKIVSSSIPPLTSPTVLPPSTSGRTHQQPFPLSPIETMSSVPPLPPIISTPPTNATNTAEKKGQTLDDHFLHVPSIRPAQDPMKIEMAARTQKKQDRKEDETLLKQKQETEETSENATNMLQLSRTSSLRRSHVSNLGAGSSALVPLGERVIKKSHMDLGSSKDGASQHTTEDGQLFINTAQYKGSTVAWKKLRKNRVKLDRALLVEMRHMTDVKSSNLATFIGASVEMGDVFEVWEYCTKGSLQDVIWNDNIKLDEMFKFSISVDIFKGLKYIHDGPLKIHGRVKSSNCVIDGRWACKLTDYGLFELRSGQDEDPEISIDKKMSELSWTAPELLNSMDKDGRITKISQEGDIYAGSIILKEIFARNGPYTELDYMTPEEIIDEVRRPKNPKKPFRPDLSEFKDRVPPKLLQLMNTGWSEKPSERPSAGGMARGVQNVNPNKSTNVMDNMIKMMERYSTNLEGMIQERTGEIEEEKKRSEQLLYRMLPRPVAEDLKIGKPINPENYDSVSIYFSDIVSFTKLAGASTPMQVVDLLNDLYTIFDSTIEKHDVYKVETIGDAYMYVSGLPIRNGDNHAVEVTNCAMDLLSGIVGFKVRHLPDYVLKIRIGLHTGPVVAGVVGVTMPRYCLFGDTVTIASTMESGGSPMRVHMSENTYKLVSKFSGYYLSERGLMEVKGKGKIMTYFVVSREGYTDPFPDYDELAVEDDPPCKKLPVTKGRQLRTGPARPSAESGFYDMTGPGDTLSTGDVALSRKTSAVVGADTPTLDDIQENENSNEQIKPVTA